ncbi:MAG: hypothetical protein M3R13_08205 [Armatimonadota bacterium]|nr:hypothetical protein [Armatimonadota bacterium]
MSKFNLPEYEIYGVDASDVTRMGEMLIVTAQEALLGSAVPVGRTVDTPFGRLTTMPGTRNRAQWGERPTVELSLA